jgi:hypothetical protein
MVRNGLFRFKAMGILAVLVLSFTEAPHASGQVLYRINCGGPAYVSLPWVYVDRDGHPSDNDRIHFQWSADTFFTGGGSYTNRVDIASSAADTLFQTERWITDAPDDVKYSIPVPNAEYSVGFYFAEIAPDFSAIGKRVFNITMNGVEVFHNFDIFAVAGAKKAYVEQKTLKVTDGLIRIGFSNVVHHGKISALEVIRAPMVPGWEAPYRINCGGDDYYDAQGIAWETDRHYFGGSTLISDISIAGNPNQSVIRSERWNNPTQENLRYVFDLIKGTYTVRLHFAEPWEANRGAGKRVFNVSLNGKMILDHFDIFTAAGFAKEIIKEFPLTISEANGVATLEFQNVIKEAKINAIEILPTITTTLRPALIPRLSKTFGINKRAKNILGQRIAK